MRRLLHTANYRHAQGCQRRTWGVVPREALPASPEQEAGANGGAVAAQDAFTEEPAAATPRAGGCCGGSCEAEAPPLSSIEMCERRGKKLLRCIRSTASALQVT